MKKKIFLFLPFLDEFISKSERGKRLKKDGKKLATTTINNYKNLRKLLVAFEQTQPEPLRIIAVNKLSQKEMIVEKNYWKRFYKRFSEFLYKRGVYDNYVGMVFKSLKVVFKFIQQEKLINVGEFYKQFHVLKEEVPIITLMPEQLKFLIQNTDFEKEFSDTEKEVRDIFVFGCTVALRFSDLFSIRVKDVEAVLGNYYLSVQSQKTETLTRVKLPEYAVAIINQFKKGKTANTKLFPFYSLFWFNKNLKRIAEKLGWTYEIGKSRSKMGVSYGINKSNKKSYRFCDMISSHIMRRTAITTMLMHEVPERVVRKISGHSEGSKAFGRYVNLVQSYIDESIDRHYERMGV